MNRHTPDAASEASFSFPHTYQEMDYATLVTLSAMKTHGARIEILKRHIMTVDRCSYHDATKVSEMNDSNCFRRERFLNSNFDRCFKKLRIKTEKEWLLLPSLTKLESFLGFRLPLRPSPW
jgi:hypothetical protein